VRNPVNHAQVAARIELGRTERVIWGENGVNLVLRSGEGLMGVGLVV
jgi:hypothetical protein